MTSVAGDTRPVTTHDADFTVAQYRQLLRLARGNWPLVSYESIPFGQRFLLWRHDCDYSLNRALALARIEHEEGIRATYFINPHCEFYHLLERSQMDIVRELVVLGHDVALHFDGMFHATRDEGELVRQLEADASLLENALGTRPAAFSFHNPSAFHLSCDKEIYADMVNCYSLRFKTEVAYCSDSNGYWRFRRLHDVLEQASDTSLQVLTHPGWWQDEQMTPREKVFRCVYGRAAATFRFFDAAIDAGTRTNPAGTRREVSVMRWAGRHICELSDQLFHQRHFVELLLILWRTLCQQTRSLCEAQTMSMHRQLSASTRDCADRFPSIWFERVFGVPWVAATGIGPERCCLLDQRVQSLLTGGHAPDAQELSDDCLELFNAIGALARWGQEHDLAWHGLDQSHPAEGFPDRNGISNESRGAR